MISKLQSKQMASAIVVKKLFVATLLEFRLVSK